ncbi:MAG: thioredoxin family protein [Oscillospiraceae bacterium]|nr:thioredoxin family protein [Oscillospiraceae bacterium]
MDTLLFFRLAHCPYCVAAANWIKELINENPQYAKIEIKTIDEQIEKEFADSYNYYYVPAFFYNGKKLHEGAATKEKIKKVFDDVISSLINR